MSEEYTHQLLRMVVGRICQQLGWQAMHSSSCDVLVDIMKHYMFTVAKTTSAYSFLGEPHRRADVVLVFSLIPKFSSLLLPILLLSISFSFVLLSSSHTPHSLFPLTFVSSPPFALFSLLQLIGQNLIYKI